MRVRRAYYNIVRVPDVCRGECSHLKSLVLGTAVYRYLDSSTKFSTRGTKFATKFGTVCTLAAAKKTRDSRYETI